MINKQLWYIYKYKYIMVWDDFEGARVPRELIGKARRSSLKGRKDKYRRRKTPALLHGESGRSINQAVRATRPI
jgi:hypothetical protein